MLRYGYVGCMRNLKMNGIDIDLARYAKVQNPKNIRAYCRQMTNKCEDRPCLHDGDCKEGWNRFICDCSATSYTGPMCNKAAPKLSFNGAQYLKISMPESIQSSEAEDIVLRFYTNRPNGLLLSTGRSTEQDSLQLSLEAGRIKLSINLGTGSKEIYAGNGLNDDNWHLVRVRRQAREIRLQIDDEQPTWGNIGKTVQR